MPYQRNHQLLYSLLARVVYCTGMSVVAAGCSTPHTIDPSFVASRWSTTLSAFNIDPVFLPRQVHLGDIYLAGEFDGDPDRDAKRWQRRTIYLGRAPVRDAIIRDTQSRLRIPRTSVTDPSDDVFDAPTLTTTLRPVAFPGFNVSEIRESDFAAAFPVKLFRVLFGGSKSGELVMSISIPNAEYEEVPGLDAWDKLGEFCWKEGEEPICAASNPVLQSLFNNLKLPSDTGKGKLVPKVGIVTSVFYARQINYFYNTGKTSALGVTASLPMAPVGDGSEAASKSASTNTVPTNKNSPSGGSGSPPTPEAPGSAANKTGETRAAPAPAADSATAALHAQVEVLQKQIDELQKNGEGASKFGAIRVVSSTSEGTLLSQTFERPVAIGYRALWMYPLGYKPLSAPVRLPAQ